jgi:hypothetical protein
LNERDDPDLTKPRSSSSGHCIYIHGENGENGVVRFRVPKEAANARLARQAADERARTPPHVWKAPGFDEDDLKVVAKLLDG